MHSLYHFLVQSGGHPKDQNRGATVWWGEAATVGRKRTDVVVDVQVLIVAVQRALMANETYNETFSGPNLYNHKKLYILVPTPRERALSYQEPRFQRRRCTFAVDREHTKMEHGFPVSMAAVASREMTSTSELMFGDEFKV